MRVRGHYCVFVWACAHACLGIQVCICALIRVLTMFFLVDNDALQAYHHVTKLTFDANIQSLEGIDQKIEAEKESKRIREEGKETKKKKRSPPWFYRKREQVFMIIHDMSIWVGSPSLHPS